MSGTTHQLFIGLWVFGVAAIALAALVQYCFYRRLKSQHAGAWQNLGLGASPGNAEYVHAIGRFIRKKSYLELNDPVLNRWAKIIFFSKVAFLIAFVSAFALAWIPVVR
jgi:hypothetical protein